MLNKSTGNMYDFVTHTWNTIKGACPHDCSYCYMKRWGGQHNVRLDPKEFNTDLGRGNFIFVGSSCDMFADEIPSAWILDTISHCQKYDNSYLFQSKNPSRMILLPEGMNAIVCTTIETNRWYPDIMQHSPHPRDRSIAMDKLPFQKYVTIEPIMDFDLDELVSLISAIRPFPVQVNIGADSGNNRLPEPSMEKVAALVSRLKEFTIVAKKRNLKRLELNHA